MTAPDPWNELRRHTAARIALGRAGSSLPTAEWLRFSLAHAQARDAVHLPLDVDPVVAGMAALGLPVLRIDSAAGDRATYLRRPDLGRRPSIESARRLSASADAPNEVVVMVGDGLSARAIHSHAVPLVASLQPLLQTLGLPISQVVVARQARVALGDEVGSLLRARAVLVLIGERPGLSSPDSLGAYLTWAPQPGRSDAQRNCVSNIRPEGLVVDRAAARIAWLIDAACRLGATGVALKDESGDGPAPTLNSSSAAPAPDAALAGQSAG
jgi:ethanolamine ammonia-lyase small subunit